MCWHLMSSPRYEFTGMQDVISLNGEILETYIVVHSRGKYIYSLPPEKIIAFAETIKENVKFSIDPFVKKSGLTFLKKVMTIAFREHLK